MAAGCNPLSAKHQYNPESFLAALKLSFPPILMLSPSFTHVIFGLGLPLAEQANATMVFSITVLFEGLVVILGGTETKTKKKSMLK